MAAEPAKLVEPWGAGSLFTLTPAALFWAAALILLIGAALSLVWRGPARKGEMAA